MPDTVNKIELHFNKDGKVERQSSVEAVLEIIRAQALGGYSTTLDDFKRISQMADYIEAAAEKVRD